jgi:hypothetical protein
MERKMKAKNFTVTPKLSEINARRAVAGLVPLVAGKTAKKNRVAQNANAANRAQANRDMKSNRQRKGK